MEEAKAHGASAEKIQRFQNTLDDLKKTMNAEELASIGATRAASAAAVSLDRLAKSANSLAGMGAYCPFPSSGGTPAQNGLYGPFLQRLTNGGSSPGGFGMPLEEYPWEGPSSNFGPKGNRLGLVMESDSVSIDRGSWARSLVIGSVCVSPTGLQWCDRLMKRQRDRTGSSSSPRGAANTNATAR